MRVIVAGKVYVDPEVRERAVAAHRVIVERAREYPGCLDVSISADSVEPGRVNLFEYWESHEALDAWRAIAPAATEHFELKDVQVLKHEVSGTRGPFD
ncbi:putative quinol monooxygenase [Kribbella ginsengisoli]|uniref:ABM domain-containing protein n=1 Tax=Kribbella ginsengisoli TaxID=363865 RepID=A0ABP6WCS8_9ACTN